MDQAEAGAASSARKNKKPMLAHELLVSIDRIYLGKQSNGQLES